MSAKLFHVALTLTLACAVSLQYADARSLGDVTGGDDVTRSRDKRSARLAGVAGLPVMAAGGRSTRAAGAGAEAEAWGLLSGDERAQLAGLLADTVLLEQLRHRRPLRQAWETPYDQLDYDDLIRNAEDAKALLYGTEDGGLGQAEPRLEIKRTPVGHLRSPRELHPVYLGLGQNAASAALNTYASMLADEKRRQTLAQQQQSSQNPVRFIGKR